jgi:hypothetical protein
MTGPEHYREADRILTELVNGEIGHTTEFPPERLLVMAQVHAALALTSATALHEEYADIRDWREATGQEGQQ